MTAQPPCPRCLFPAALCLCPEIPRLTSAVRVIVLRHASEIPRVTSTARWAALALGAQIVDYGLPGAPPDLGVLAVPRAALLFPTPRAPQVPLPRPLALVVPDGTWQQARRMVQRVPALRALPRLALATPPRVTRIRRAPAGGMSTLEAIAAALAALGEGEAAARLSALHAAGVDRVRRWTGSRLAAA